MIKKNLRERWIISMKRKVSKINLWIITIGLFLIVVFDENITRVTQISFIIVMCMCCPFVHEIFYRKSKIKISPYRFMQTFLPFFSVIIAVYVAFFIIFCKEIEDLDLSEMILKICVYFIYMIVIDFVSAENKRKEYYIFGIIYIICLLISFIPSKYNTIIVRLLNVIFGYQHMDEITYEFIIEAILMPIKEAVLTYIIFDTVKDNIKKEEKEFNVIVERKNSENKKEYLVKIGKKEKFTHHQRTNIDG